MYVCNGKKIKELFASALNVTAASVRCVSSMIVVLDVKSRFVAAHAKKKDGEKRRSLTKVPFLLVEAHKH